MSYDSWAMRRNAFGVKGVAYRDSGQAPAYARLG
jgi:hypothetical protein